MNASSEQSDAAVFQSTLPIRGATGVLQLLLNMNQRSLAATEGKVRQTEQLEKILLAVDYPMR